MKPTGRVYSLDEQENGNIVEHNRILNSVRCIFDRACSSFQPNSLCVFVVVEVETIFVVTSEVRFHDKFYQYGSFTFI